MANPPLKSPLSVFLLVILGSILIITSLVLLIANQQLWSVEQKKIIAERADTIAQSIEYATEDLIETKSLYSITERIVQNFATFADVLQIEIIAPNGEIIISSPNDSRVQFTWKTWRPNLVKDLERVAKSGTSFLRYVEADYFGMVVKVLPFNSNLFINQEKYGLIVVVLQLERLETRATQYLLMSGSLIFTGLTIAIVGVYIAFYQRVILPLQQLQNFLTQINYGTSRRWPHLHADEIGFLGQVLREKIEELDNFNQELDQQVSAATGVLKETEKFLQSILNYLPIALFVKEANPQNFGKIVLWNPAAEKLFGFSAPEVYGKTVFHLYPFQQANLYDQDDRRAVSENRLVDLPEERFEWGQGDKVRVAYLHIRRFPLTDSQGQPQFLLCMAEDVSQRKQAKDSLEKLNQELELKVRARTESLQDSELRYRSLLEGASDALVIANLEGYLVQVNQKALELFGYSQEEILGLHLSQLHPTQVLGETLNTFRLIISQTQAKCSDTLIITKSGNAIPVDITASLVPLRGESLVMEIFRDISERKLAEQETAKALQVERQLTQLKSQFIDVASHEFRTPLTVILGAAEFLDKYYLKLDDAKKHHYLNRIIEAGQRMRGMIEDVLILSRLDAGKIELHYSGIYVGQFCQKLIEEIEADCQHSHSINWQLNYPGLAADFIYADTRILYPILSNLLSNAIKYSPQSTTVNLEATLETSQIIFKVTDQGLGIPQEDLPYIFESFHRASNVLDINGTGLGLNIVKRYVELYGGSIDVFSCLGKGSEFTLTLPVFST